MTRIAVLPLTLTLFAPAISAHDDDRDRYYSSRDRGYRGGGSLRGADLVDSAIYDLQRIAQHSYVDGHEAKHFRRAIHELSEFQRRASRGDFERKRLDRAVEDLDHLSHARQIHPRDRGTLRGHAARLNALRSGSAGYGYRSRGRW